VIILLNACVAIPIPRLESPEIDQKQLKVIEIGTSTSAEIEAVLGEPDIIWKTERIWVYEQGPSGHILWIVAAGYSGGIAVTDLADDVVILRFDESDRIERIDCRTRPANPANFGNFLREWLAEQIQKPVSCDNSSTSSGAGQ
jgi:hypothetical protein